MSWDSFAGEGNFSKLKFIKTNLQSSLTQEKGNSFAILSQENNIVKTVDIESVMKTFGELKLRGKMC